MYNKGDCRFSPSLMKPRVFTPWNIFPKRLRIFSLAVSNRFLGNKKDRVAYCVGSGLSKKDRPYKLESARDVK